MIKRGSYNVQDVEEADGKPPAEDTSFKSCLCVILLFIALCGLIILFTSIQWVPKDKSKMDESEIEVINNNYDKDKHVGRIQNKTETSPILPTSYQNGTTHTTSSQEISDKAETTKSTMTSMVPRVTTQGIVEIKQSINTEITEYPVITTQKVVPHEQTTFVTLLDFTTKDIVKTDQPKTDHSEATESPIFITKMMPPHNSTAIPRSITLQTVETTSPRMRIETDPVVEGQTFRHNGFTERIIAQNEDVYGTTTIKFDLIDDAYKTTTERTEVATIIIGEPAQKPTALPSISGSTTLRTVETRTPRVEIKTDPVVQGETDHHKTLSTESMTAQNENVYRTITIKFGLIDDAYKTTTERTEVATIVIGEPPQKPTALPSISGSTTLRTVETRTPRMEIKTDPVVQGETDHHKTLSTESMTAQNENMRGTGTIKFDKEVGIYVPTADRTEPTTIVIGDTKTESSSTKLRTVANELVMTTTEDYQREPIPTNFGVHINIPTTNFDDGDDETTLQPNIKFRDLSDQMKKSTKQTEETSSRTIGKTSPTERYSKSSIITAEINIDNSSKPTTIWKASVHGKSTPASEHDSFEGQITDDFDDYEDEDHVTQKQATAKSINKATATKYASDFKLETEVASMLYLMDHSADRCEDFYSYACGAGYVDKASVMEEVKNMNRISRQLDDIDENGSPVFLRQLKKFYNSCVKHEAKFSYNERLDQVKGILKNAGEVSNKNVSSDELTKLFAKLVLAKSLPVMDVGVDIDAKNNKYVFQLSPPYKSLTVDEADRWSTLYKLDLHCIKELRGYKFKAQLDLNKMYDEYTKCKKNYASYIQSFEITTHSIDYLSAITGLNYFVDTQILNTTTIVTTSELRDALLSKSYSVVKVGTLAEKFGKLNWKLFFNMISEQKITDDTEVFVYLKETLFKIFKELNSLDEQDIYNDLFAMYANDVYQNIIIPKSTDDRENYCMKLSSNLFDDVISYLYMKSLTEKEMSQGNNLVDEIFSSIKTHFGDAVKKSQWMGDSQEEVLRKINSLSYRLMTKTDECISEDTLKDQYANIGMGEVFGPNYVRMLERRSSYNYGLVGKKFNANQMFCHFTRPYDEKPVVLYVTNEIAIPYGILTPWTKKHPSYFLMARVGMKLALAIGQHFDEIGIQHRINLNDEESEKYKSFAVENPISVKLQTEVIQLTASPVQNNQAIADNAALRMLYFAYDAKKQNSDKNIFELPWIKNDFTNDQIFFISTAQELCEKTDSLEYMLRIHEGRLLPNNWRVNSMIISSENFKRVFQCKDGSGMDPSDANKSAFPHLVNDAEYED